MTDPERDIDVLIKQLKDESMLVNTQSSLAIESWFALWQKRLVPIFKLPRHRLYEPLQPRLAELMSAHLDDAMFVDRAYIFLIGRSSDQQGATYYRQMAACEGRISALIELLESGEAQAYAKQQRLKLPGHLLRLSRWRQRLVSLPGIGRGAWRLVAGLVWRHYEQRWREAGEYYGILAHYGKRQDEHRTLAMTLAEMANIQQRIVAQINAASYDQSSSNTQFAKWLTAEQAVAMMDMLKRAEQELSSKEEKTS
ncbi:hypothetical protein ACTXPD_13395 [Vreelandella alkaliphila]|uniref:hypothetical protein n=1 Tax=Vreelandella alkaliphila TaxID=272774 RepID=UPI003FD73ABE